MSRLILLVFALVMASAIALEAAPELDTTHTVNLAQSSAPAAPAKPFFDPLLMYNPYMCAIHLPAHGVPAVLRMHAKFTVL